MESYFVRRLFAEVSTKALGGIFNNLYKDIKNKNNSKNIVDNLLDVLRSFEKNKRWPEDEEFRQGIITKSVYTKSRAHRIKLILERLETSLSKEQVNLQNLTDEHIMPQTLTPEWKSMLGSHYAQDHKKWLHTLGNLTLTAYNSELSNKTFSKKLVVLKKSNLSLNQFFRNSQIDKWDANAIQYRAKYLADLAVKVWPR